MARSRGWNQAQMETQGKYLSFWVLNDAKLHHFQIKISQFKMLPRRNPKRMARTSATHAEEAIHEENSDIIRNSQALSGLISSRDSHQSMEISENESLPDEVLAHNARLSYVSEDELDEDDGDEDEDLEEDDLSHYDEYPEDEDFWEWTLGFPEEDEQAHEEDSEELSDKSYLDLSENEFIYSDDSESDDQADESFMRLFLPREEIENITSSSEEEDDSEIRNVLNSIPSRIDITTLSEKTKSDGWNTVDYFQPQNIRFSSETPGPKNISENLKSPIEFWKLLITEEMLQDICKFSNNYAEEWKNADEDEIFNLSNPEKNKFKPKPKWLAKWKDMTVEDLKRFIAIQYLMSFIRLPQIKNYWDKSKYFFSIPRISTLMKRSRFSQIKSCFHLCFFRSTLQNNPKDPLWKISQFLNLFLRNCRFYYTCSLDLSGDEMMLRFNGRNSMKFSQQPKPTPNGFKMIALNDAKNAYTYAAILDTRETGTAKEKYILKLVGKVGKYRTVVLDRGYVTISLAEKLLKKGFYVVGTIKRYKNIPQEILKFKIPGRQTQPLRKRKGNEIDDIDEEKKEEEKEEEGNSGYNAEIPIIVDSSQEIAQSFSLSKGEWAWLMKKTPMIIVTWHDSGMCLALSTRHGPTGSTVERRTKGVVGKETKTCPELIDYYNQKMGGVDRADALRSQLTTIRRCKKWWHSIWYWILDTAFINAKILYEESCNRDGPPIKRSDFLHDIIESLLKEGGFVSSLGKTKSAHYPNKRKKRGHCVNCFELERKRKFTNNICMQCNKYLHVECFAYYHQKVDRDSF